jgi:hypothetical protein
MIDHMWSIQIFIICHWEETLLFVCSLTIGKEVLVHLLCEKSKILEILLNIALLWSSEAHLQNKELNKLILNIGRINFQDYFVKNEVNEKDK